MSSRPHDESVGIGAPSATVSVAVAAEPLGISFEVTALVVLTLLPVLMPTTLMLKLQLPFAGSVAPARLTVDVDPGAVIVPPPQEPVRPL